MFQLQTSWLIGLLSLALLVTACQPASEPARLPLQETAISQAATTASPTALPTPTITPSPTATPSPTTTLARTSQGDQLPTRSPTSPATPTAIPAEEPVPSTIATRPLPTPTLASVSEVDLPALEESLVLLDRLDRRKGKPTPTPVGPIIFEGQGYVTLETCPDTAGCLVGCEGSFTAEIVWEAEGNNISGVFEPNMFLGNIPFAGTHNSLTGERSVIYEEMAKAVPCEIVPSDIFLLQATLTEDGQKFEGTKEHTSTPCISSDSGHFCKTVWTFSLTRK